MTNNILSDLHSAISRAQLPNSYLKRITDVDQTDIMEIFSDVGSMHRSAAEVSEDDTKGLVSGLVVLGGALMGTGLISENNKDEVALKLIAKCDEEYTNNLESIITDLVYWYPNFEEYIETIREDPFRRGVVLALYVYHTWLKTKNKGDFDHNIMKEAVSSPFKQEAPAHVEEALELEEVPFTEEEPAVDPVSTLFASLAGLSDIDVSFKFGVLEGELVIWVLCPNGIGLETIRYIELALGQTRLFCENGSIRLAVTPFVSE